MVDWITTEEASQLTGYSVAHLLLLLRQKRIKAEKKGGQYWVDRGDLLEYASQAAKAKSEDRRHGAKGKRTT
jgi:excisionase family DNA binding protein